MCGKRLRSSGEHIDMFGIRRPFGPGRGFRVDSLWFAMALVAHEGHQAALIAPEQWKSTRLLSAY